MRLSKSFPHHQCIFAEPGPKEVFSGLTPGRLVTFSGIVEGRTDTVKDEEGQFGRSPTEGKIPTLVDCQVVE